MSDRVETNCPKCDGPLAWRQAHPYPALFHGLFGVSFILFLIFLDRVREHRALVWGWSAAQAIAGVFLIRLRLRAKRRILVCIRCGEALP